MKNSVLIPAICPQCSAKIQLSKNLEKGYCSFCGTEIIIKDVVNKVKIVNNPTFENFVKLADRAFVSGDYSKAHENFTRALEINPDDWNTVYKEGLAFANISYSNVRNIDKVVISSKNAIELLQENKAKDEDFAKAVISMCNDFYLLIMQYFNYWWDLYYEKLPNSLNNLELYWDSLSVLRKVILYVLNELFTDKNISLYPKNDKDVPTYYRKVDLMKLLLSIDIELCEVRKYTVISSSGASSNKKITIDKDFQNYLLQEYDYFLPIILEAFPDTEVYPINRKQKNSIF